MATTKKLKRTFASELQSLPVQLVPPDPAPRSKGASRAATESLPGQSEVEAEVLTKLISKIKRI